MLSTNKLRSIYSKIQTQLFYMIPEKWDKIYLYASIIEQVNHLETGEMFFYYYPAGIIKRNPVNVYEVPAKFNIDEEEYMKLVDKLYSTFNELRQAFKESNEEKMWTNLTIIIGDNKFTVEYNYEDLIGSKYSSDDRHIIWQCKYLNYPIEKFSNKDRKMLKEYNIENTSKENKTKTYSEGMYKKHVHNIIEYKNYDEDKMQDFDSENKQNKNEIKEEPYEIVTNKRLEKLKRKIDRYELYKQNQEKQKHKENIVQNDEKPIRKNQILNV